MFRHLKYDFCPNNDVWGCLPATLCVKPYKLLISSTLPSNYSDFHCLWDPPIVKRMLVKNCELECSECRKLQINKCQHPHFQQRYGFLDCMYAVPSTASLISSRVQFTSWMYWGLFATQWSLLRSTQIRCSTHRDNCMLDLRVWSPSMRSAVYLHIKLAGKHTIPFKQVIIKINNLSIGCGIICDISIGLN